VTLDEYQLQAQATAFYPRATHKEALAYCALGLSGEAGEVAEHIKKYLRDGTLDEDAVIKEMGDVLWYLAQLGAELGVLLSDVAGENLAKLQSRKERGVLQGSGSDR
jgi:NTP pyrophosphatase (non-canonical NTP hydrolase)